MLMLRARPNDGKHERGCAETDPDEHRAGSLPRIDPVPFVSQGSPRRVTDGLESQASDAASKASPRRRDPLPRENAQQGGPAGGAAGVEATPSRQAAAGAGRPEGPRPGGPAPAGRVAVSPPAAPPARPPRLATTS